MKSVLASLVSDDQREKEPPAVLGLYTPLKNGMENINETINKI